MRFERVRDPRSSMLDPQTISHTPIRPYSHTEWKPEPNVELHKLMHASVKCYGVWVLCNDSDILMDIFGSKSRILCLVEPVFRQKTALSAEIDAANH